MKLKNNFMWCVMFFDRWCSCYKPVKGFTRLSCCKARFERVNLNRKYPEFSFISVPLN